MKKKISLLFFTLLAICTMGVNAQEESKSSFTAGADFYSNYVWRGSLLGTGPAFQPSVKFTSGIFTAGVWGSFDAAGYAEADPYISFGFKNGLSLGLTDYYYPRLGGSFTSDSTNAVEINAGYAVSGLSLSANYILNKTSVAGSAGNDKYFQASYAFKKFSLTVGAGDGWHTSDGKFNICNIALGTGKEIKITESFSIPVTGQIIFNPDKNRMFMVVGFSL